MCSSDLTIVGTAAMFLVGGGIIAHGIPVLHHLTEEWLALVTSAWLALPASLLLNGAVGVVAGGLLVPIVEGFRKLRTLIQPSS